MPPARAPYSPLAVLPYPPAVALQLPLLMLLYPPLTALAFPLAVLQNPPDTVAIGCKAIAPLSSPAWLPSPPATVPNATVARLAQFPPQSKYSRDPRAVASAPCAPPPETTAPLAAVAATFALLPITSNGEMGSGITCSARVPPTATSNVPVTELTAGLKYPTRSIARFAPPPRTCTPTWSL